jgi:hypothetical protein
VLQFVLGDGNNPLGTYAAKNATAGKASAAAKPVTSQSETPLYQLGQNRYDVNEQGQANCET